MNAILLFVLAVISFLITRALISGAIPLNILDHPNERSLHTKVVPRTGGVAILCSILVGLLAGWVINNSVPSVLHLLMALLLIAICSFADDIKGLSVVVRLCIHLSAVALLIHAGFVLSDVGVFGMEVLLPSLLAIMVTVLFVIWSINLYNFMDGMDGFAAGMTIIGFGVLAIIGFTKTESAFAFFNACLVAAVFGFWVFNFPPAKIFMGDLGSSILGFSFAVVSLWGVKDDIFSIWIPCIVFSPFIVDATYTVIKRAASGERFWEAHKTHFYQRLVEAGYGHRKVVMAEYLLMSVCGLFALVLANFDTVKSVQLVGILLTGTLYTVIILILNKKLRGKSHNH